MEIFFIIMAVAWVSLVIVCVWFYYFSDFAKQKKEVKKEWKRIYGNELDF